MTSLQQRQTLIDTITAAERTHILSVVNSDEFADLPPSRIVPRLADQGMYLACESTIDRILKAGQ
jgi:hypothetical protein